MQHLPKNTDKKKVCGLQNGQRPKVIRLGSTCKKSTSNTDGKEVFKNPKKLEFKTLGKHCKTLGNTIEKYGVVNPKRTGKSIAQANETIVNAPTDDRLKEGLEKVLKSDVELLYGGWFSLEI